MNGLLTATGIEKLTGRSETLTIDTHGQHRLNLDAARANLAALFADDPDFDDDDDGDEAEYEDDGDAADEDASNPSGAPPGPTGKASPAPPGLLASAKTLRQRAEALTASGLSEKDASDIASNLEAIATAIQSRSWTSLQTLTETLSDILFYLED